MKAIKIRIQKVSNYYRFVQDRDMVRPGEVLSGVVHFDPPGRRPPAETRVLLTDSLGRIIRSVPGTWNDTQGVLEFSIPTEKRVVAMLNFLEVDISGCREARERVVVTRSWSPWDDFHIFVWAHYPSNYYPALREAGFDGVVAYKREQADHVLENNFLCYVDQVSPEEVSVYHRPYHQYWEMPEKPTRSRKKLKWFEFHWDMIRQRYKKARQKLEGRSVADDLEARKTLYRVSCPSDPAVVAAMRERILTTVAQHKALRPMFYNLCDEPGTGDQAAPFDFCYCRHCLESFRVWLEKRYSDLSALNRQWGTHFRTWNEVVPRTADDILHRQKSRGDYNFSSWADHREFMDDLMSSTYAKMRAFAREADPNALYGNTGGQGPNAYGGWDFAKITRSVDLHVPYNVSQNDDMIRSFPPRILKMAPFFGRDKRLVRRMWYQAFHGDCGQIHWDAHEPKGCFLQVPGRKRTIKAARLAPAMVELSRGLGKELLTLRRREDGIALHHSQPSVRAHWMLGAIPQGERWVDRGSTDCEAVETDVSFRLRDSLTKLIADAGCSSEFAAYDDIAAGGLECGKWKILFLHHSLAMSRAECDAVRRFAERGGVVVADALPAVMDDHCRLLPSGRLDDFFGVRRGRFDYRKSGPRLRITGKSDPFGLRSGLLSLKACEPTLRALEPGTAYARAGRADGLVVRRVGRGMAVYLNAELRNYAIWRYRPGTAEERDARRLILGALRLAGIEPEIRVTVANQDPVPGLEINRYSGKGVDLIGLVVNEMRFTSGVGEEKKVRLTRFDTPSAIRVRIGQERHVYDCRAGEYLGRVSEFPAKFDPMDAGIYALLAYRVRGVEIAAKGPFKRGDIVQVALALNTAPARPGPHVVRCDAYAPDGSWISHYSHNILMNDGSATWELPLALNDPAGKWTLRVRDVLSGIRQNFEIEVRE